MGRKLLVIILVAITVVSALSVAAVKIFGKKSIQATF